MSQEQHMAEAIITALLSHGLPGIIIAGLGFWLYRTQRELNKLQEARVEDAKKFTAQALALNDKTHEDIANLKEFVEFVEKHGAQQQQPRNMRRSRTNED